MTRPDNPNKDPRETGNTAVVEPPSPSSGTDADFVSDNSRGFFARLFGR